MTGKLGSASQAAYPDETEDTVLVAEHQQRQQAGPPGMQHDASAAVADLVFGSAGYGEGDGNGALGEGFVGEGTGAEQGLQWAVIPEEGGQQGQGEGAPEEVDEDGGKLENASRAAAAAFGVEASGDGQPEEASEKELAAGVAPLPKENVSVNGDREAPEGVYEDLGQAAGSEHVTAQPSSSGGVEQHVQQQGSQEVGDGFSPEEEPTDAANQGQATVQVAMATSGAHPPEELSAQPSGQSQPDVQDSQAPVAAGASGENTQGASPADQPLASSEQAFTTLTEPVASASAGLSAMPSTEQPGQDQSSSRGDLLLVSSPSNSSIPRSPAPSSPRVPQALSPSRLPLPITSPLAASQGVPSSGVEGARGRNAAGAGNGAHEDRGVAGRSAHANSNSGAESGTATVSVSRGVEQRSSGAGEQGAGAGGGMHSRSRPRALSLPGPAHTRVNVSSPTREERMQRRKWAELAEQRKAVVAQRLQADEAQMQQEMRERMEARRAAVRARIENEKLVQKAMAEERAAKLACLEQPPPPIRGKRNPSPRPLYLRLQEDYEARVMSEEEEKRKRLEMLSAMKRARVAALVSGEVTIKPLPDEVRPKDVSSPPRWLNSFKASSSPSISPRGSYISPSASVFKDLPADAASSSQRQPFAPHFMQDNGMVLYSLQSSEGGSVDGCSTYYPASHHPPGAGGPPNRQHSLSEQQCHHHQQGPASQAGGRRFTGGRFCSLSRPVDRGCSPIQVDPNTKAPINCPPQEQFWRRGSLNPSPSPPPQRVIMPHTHLSNFSMPIKLREMTRPASRTPAASKGTGSSPPPPPPPPPQQQQQHSKPSSQHSSKQEVRSGKDVQGSAGPHAKQAAHPPPQQVSRPEHSQHVGQGPAKNIRAYDLPNNEAAFAQAQHKRSGQKCHQEVSEPWHEEGDRHDESGSLPDADMLAELDAEIGSDNEHNEEENKENNGNNERAEEGGGEEGGNDEDEYADEEFEEHKSSWGEEQGIPELSLADMQPQVQGIVAT